jgi:hypothetical protein
MLRSLFLIFVIFNSFLLVYSQNSVAGRVVDAASHQPLAFVNITIPHRSEGASTDIDGKFRILSAEPIRQLQFTYVGYEPQLAQLAGDKEWIIRLKRKEVELLGVEIRPGVNPADRIIEQASRYRLKNNPEKNVSFTYTSYNKLYMTADFKGDADTINSLDTIRHRRSRTQKLFDKQHLFLTESVSKRKYLHPGRNHEELIATRTSGMKTPLFTAFGDQMQSFSFYDNTIKLFDRTYLNPLVSGSITKYLFILEDTIYSGKDSVFVLSFQPRKGMNFDGLKGVLYINSNQYAIQNVIAKPFVTEGLFTIRVQQKYEWIDGKQWFPVQLNTDLYYNDFSVSDTTLKLSSSSRRKKVSDNLEGKLKIVSRSYISEVVLNPSLRKKEFGSLELEIDPGSGDKNEAFWSRYRKDSLSQRDRKTYQVIDSVGETSHLDLKVQALSAIVDGQVQWKYLCFDLNRIIGVNEYEQVRAGLGLHTSRKLSSFFTVGGYGGWGFADKQFKFGGDISVFPYRKNRDYAITYAYVNDITESAGISFFQEFTSLNTESLRTELLAVFDKVEMHKFSCRFRALNYFLCNLYLSEEYRQPTNGYRYGYLFDGGQGSATWNRFYFAETGLQIKYLYREKFTEFLNTRISEGSKYPVVYVNIAKGFANSGFLRGDFVYMKYEVKLTKRFITAKAGKPAVQLMGGFVDGNLPYSKLFAGRGTFVNYSIAVPNTFETMGLNEFLSDRYVALFYTHDFGRLFLRKEHFQPQVLYVNRVCFGSLGNPDQHFNMPFKTLEKGYYETGFLLNNLIRRGYLGVGAGIFYRYGPYAFVDESKNAAVKFSISINF